MWWVRDYASERGVSFSNPSGLSIWACAFNESCAMNGQGNKPCGRVLLGPYSWGHMGDNTLLNPKNTSVWGSVWLRTDAETITTTFSPAASSRYSSSGHGAGLRSSADGGGRGSEDDTPTMSVEVLAADFSVAKILPCSPRHAASSEALVIDCHLSGERSEMQVDTAGSGEEGLHIGLRFSGKQQPHHKISRGLVSTSFA